MDLAGQLPALIGDRPAIRRVGKEAVPCVVDILVMSLAGAGREQRQQTPAVDLAVVRQRHAGQLAERRKQIDMRRYDIV